MRAAFIEQTGPPEAIRVGELPKPEPGPGQVLVRVGATALNPIDLYLRSGLVAMPMAFPYIIGCDLAGTVEAVGPGPGGSGSATGSGARTRGCSAGRGRRPNTRRSTRTGSIRRPPRSPTPTRRRWRCIPSFADEHSAAPAGHRPEVFVWAGRLVAVKQPLLYVDLAAALPEARFVLVPHLRGTTSGEDAVLASCTRRPSGCRISK